MEMNPGCLAQDQIDTNELTVSYVKAEEVNLWTCWEIEESNRGHFVPAAYNLTTELPRPLSAFLNNFYTVINNTNLDIS